MTASTPALPTALPALPQRAARTGSTEPGARTARAARSARADRPDRTATEYSELSRRVQAMGLLRRRYGYYWTKASLLLLALASIWVGFGLLGDSWFQLLIAAALAVVLTQVAFLGHDAAHKQIFVSGAWNDGASLLLANLLGGLSASWWVKKHTKHHAAPNQVGKDPDIHTGALTFALEEPRPKPLGRVGAAVVARQGWFFFPLLLLEGLNLHFQSIRGLCGRAAMKRRWVELGLISVRLVGYVAVLLVFLPPGKAAAFLGVQLGVFGLYMGASFAPNHKGMPIVPAGAKVDFLRRQVLMSRNVTGGRFTAFALGGLNYQVEHHLFPSMPRPNLRRAREVVKPYCEQVGVTYTETNLWRSYGIVVRYLNQVGLAARDPFQCPLVASYRPRG